MKKVLLFVVIVLLIVGCSNEHKSKALIKDYLKTNLDDYSSYESVEYTKLIADSSTYFDDETYKYLSLKQKSIELTLGLLVTDYDEEIPIIDTVDVYGNNKTNYNDSLLAYMEKQNVFISNFKPEHIGWAMGHVFRTKKDGNLKLFKCVFHIDKNFENIVSVNFKN